MNRILTDGTTSIGVYTVPRRKKPALCIQKGSSVMVYGYFNSEKAAVEFMDGLGEFFGFPFEGEINEE